MKIRTMGAAFVYLSTLILAPALAAAEARGTVTSSEILLFTLPGCSYCLSAKNSLSRQHLAFREVDVSTQEGAKLAESLKIPAIAPVITFRGRVMQGFSEERLARFLNE